jgi:hypothetical protein
MQHYLRKAHATVWIILLFFISLPLCAFSDTQVTFQLLANDPPPAGYRLYGREEGNSYDYDSPWWEGDYTFTSCTIDQLDENTTYYFVLRAFDDEGNESGDSNEVRFNASDSDASDSGLVDNSSSGSGSGGGGSACYLNTLSDY